jgi:diguanylate cyclase (GGDEF)-like protein/PAS domain S-box-containing protein
MKSWLRKYWAYSSLRKKLLVQNMVVTVLSLICACVLLITFDQIRQYKLLEQNINVLTHVVAERSAAAVAFDDAKSAAENLKNLSFQQSVSLACLYKIDNGAWILLNQYLKANINNKVCPQEGSKTLNLSGDGISRQATELISVSPVSLDKEKIGEIFITVDYSEQISRLNTYIAMSLVIILAALLLSMLLASPIVRLILRPLSKLDKTAIAITQSDDYKLRAPKTTNDEVGSVVDSFNSMLDLIEKDNLVLRESEEKFRLLSEAAAFGIFQLSAEGKMLYSNQTLADLTNMPRHRLVVEGVVPAVHKEDQTVFQHMIVEVLRSHEAQQIEGRLMHADGKIVWVSFRLAPIMKSNRDVSGFMGAITDVSAIKEAQSKLEELAFFDPLTQLANRRLFRNELEKALLLSHRRKQSLAVMLLDLDLFKNINDSLGHDAGDELLVEIGWRLKKSVRATDMVARFGGDEFVILLDDIDSEYTVSRIASTISEELAQPFEIGGKTLTITASIGVALAPRDGNDEQSLLKYADLALYRVKESGRNGHRFFKQEMNEKLTQYLMIEKDLRQAIKNQEFILHYQPLIDLKNKKITGFEALVRWQHPEKGLIAPLDFIPIAEQTGLIKEIGLFVLQEATRQFCHMIKYNMVSSDMSVAVNLSAKQLRDETIISDIYQLLKQPNFQAHNLELELTESLLMDHTGATPVILRFLKDQGVMLSIDDFGTGYSSLSYLKKLPIHTVKIDQSFVKDIPGEQESIDITTAIIDMTHRLNYKTVAEGIETVEQMEFLSKAGCDRGQGFFISRPLAAAQLEKFCQEYAKCAS